MQDFTVIICVYWLLLLFAPRVVEFPLRLWLLANAWHGVVILDPRRTERVDAKIPLTTGRGLECSCSATQGGVPSGEVGEPEEA